MNRSLVVSALLVGTSSFVLGCGGPSNDEHGSAGGAAGDTSRGGTSGTVAGSSGGGKAGALGVGGTTASAGTTATGGVAASAGTTATGGAAASAGNGPVETFPRAFGSPEEFLGDLNHPARLHLREGYLYFTDMGLPDGTRSRLARRAPNGDVETLFEGQMIAGLFMDDDELFFAERGARTVHRMKYATLVPEVFATNALRVADIERSGDDVWMTLYDTDTFSTGIIKRSRSTGAETIVSPTTTPGFIFTYLEAASDAMYISTLSSSSAGSSGLYRMAGSAGGLWAPDISPQFLAVNAAHVYFSDVTAGVILRRAHGPTSATEIVASNQPEPYGITVDRAGVYWTSSQGCNGIAGMGAVRAAPIGGGSVVTVSESERCPESITTDGEFVYWARNPDVNVPGGGSIVRAAKLR